MLTNYAGQRMVNADGSYLGREPAQEGLATGLARILAAMPTTSRVLVLADTPTASIDPIRLPEGASLSLGACERPRAQQMPTTYNAIDAADRRELRRVVRGPHLRDVLQRSVPDRGGARADVPGVKGHFTAHSLDRSPRHWAVSSTGARELARRTD